MLTLMLMFVVVVVVVVVVAVVVAVVVVIVYVVVAGVEAVVVAVVVFACFCRSSSCRWCWCWCGWLWLLSCTVLRYMLDEGVHGSGIAEEVLQTADNVLEANVRKMKHICRLEFEHVAKEGRFDLEATPFGAFCGPCSTQLLMFGPTIPSWWKALIPW